MFVIQARSCDTCAKFKKTTHTCTVLADPIGLREECWAWTDDPAWKEEADAATRVYAEKIASLPPPDDEAGRSAWLERVLEAKLYLAKGKFLKS